ncbi:LytTR family transcriptional regulator [Streptococcus suis]|nr:LytTR family transcriptional regulator [Streptococcus suis]
MEFLIVTDNQNSLKVALSDIFYVTPSAEKPHVLTVVTVQGCYELRDTLGNLEEQLQSRFFRCHRKYLVNLEKIRGFNNLKRSILFFGDQVEDIPYSRYKKKELLKLWKWI